jgi:hypothetical protein
MIKRIITSTMMASGIGAEESCKKPLIREGVSPEGGSGLSFFECFKVKSASYRLAMR